MQDPLQSEDDDAYVFITKMARLQATTAVLERLAAKKKAGKETSPISLFESLDACRVCKFNAGDTEVFSEGLCKIVKIIKPKFLGLVDDKKAAFHWRYHVSFDITLSLEDRQYFGFSTQSVTIELPDSHLASAIANIDPVQYGGVDTDGKYLLPLPIPVIGRHSGDFRRWTKVQPLADEQISQYYVERLGSAVRVFYAGENRLVPAVDFRCAPSISERTADMGNVYKPGHTFFVFKAAAYTSLVLNLDQLDNEEDQNKDEQGRAEAACQKIDPVVLAASIKHTEQQMKEECRSRSAAVNVSQYSARTLTLVHVDERRKLAVLSGPLNLISSQDQTKAHDEFDVFDTERLVIVPLDYLASVVLRLDFKWRRAHPYKDEQSGTAFIGDTGKSYSVIFLYDEAEVAKEDCMITKHIEIRAYTPKPTKSAGGCSIM